MWITFFFFPEMIFSKDCHQGMSSSKTCCSSANFAKIANYIIKILIFTSNFWSGNFKWSCLGLDGNLVRGFQVAPLVYQIPTLGLLCTFLRAILKWVCFYIQGRIFLGPHKLGNFNKYQFIIFRVYFFINTG